MKRFLFAGEGCVLLLRLSCYFGFLYKWHLKSKFEPSVTLSVLFGIVLFICPYNVNGQISKINNSYNEFKKENFSTKYYQIGDKLPKNLVLGYNPFDSSEVITLGDFRGKAVILDLWATWCSSCIGGFPIIDSLQKLFDPKLKVLLINRQQKDSTSTGDNHEIAMKFIENYVKNNIGFSSTFLIEKTKMDEYFLFAGIPHYIWIDRNRRIRAITNSRQITKENFESLLSGRKMDLPVKTLRNIQYEVQ